MRRRTGAGGTLLSLFAASLFLFPIFAASQQQGQQHYRKSPHERGPLNDPQTIPSIPRDDRHTKTTEYRNAKDTILDPKQASAVATNAAPASDNLAVGALRPVRGSGDAGLTSPHHARSLQDWEVEDFILLATVDGSIHARDRKTGAPRWELEVDRSMVETIYHSRNKSLDDGLVSEYDFIWIIEPSKDGDIYIYNPTRHGGGLQKLHLTVKQLVEDMSPYESIDPAVVYNAEKKTKTYTVDANTGRITKVFGTGSSVGEFQPRCPKPGGLETLDDEECGPGSSFVLGRTEYTVTIQNRETTEPICTIMYSEWGPNTRDQDLHQQHSTTMDSRYVYPLHDGWIYGLDYAQYPDRQRSFKQKLSSPVVRVFDVARPLQIDEGDSELIVLPQPRPIDLENAYAFSDRNRIFVNHTAAGGWFAMSENTYPLATDQAKTAQCYDQDWQEMTSTSQAISFAQRQEGFVGVHALSDFQTWRDSGLKTISAPPPESKDEAPVSIYAESPRLQSLPAIGNSKIIGSAAANLVDILVTLLLLVGVTFWWVNRRFFSRVLKQTFELKRVPPSIEQQIASVPSTPIVAQPPWSEEPMTSMLDQVNNGLDKEQNSEEVTPTSSRRSTLLEPPALTRSRATSIDEPRGRTDQGPTVHFEERSLSRAPDDDELVSSPQPNRKKARRGCRGGAKHKKKRSNSKHEPKEEAEQTIQEISETAKEADVVEVHLENTLARVDSQVVNGSPDLSGPVIQIGHLKVYTDTVLGFGSHGTMVYKGTFGGRDVAVKRMLLEFYEIASHEVGLLQESDDHPNVIRYFDKESAGEFLYIALELCPASLADVIERPTQFPSLLGSSSSETLDVLKQITAGVQYLHSLKIVHRDIKPQNILVSAPKLVPANPSASQPPRLLISDFGLCKKLEGDQNSFRATTAHAAGTSGWRAPELLVDDDLIGSNSPHTHHTGGSHSEPAVVDPQTNRRATRAIDIFSLGCVFYYVLTGGNHPFDKNGKYMREANIVKGYHNIDELEVLKDYQWEAKDLISNMLAKEPRTRPDAGAILTHPFFWSAEDRLEFLCHVSDAFEFEPRDPPSAALSHLESYGPRILEEAGGDFLRALPLQFKDTLGKQRKYNGGRILDLLRALRNKKNHYEDMPENVKRNVGPLPEGYLGFWARRFPSLLMCCQRIVLEVGWAERDRFKKFYNNQS
ncbi:MAG: hypothetical protein Q9191_002378 [Dirinaria sp. TL-2023a]